VETPAAERRAVIAPGPVPVSAAEVAKRTTGGDALDMTDLANVWVRASSLELVRANRIVSLWLSRTIGTTVRGPAPVTIFADMKSHGSSHDRAAQLLDLIAVVAEGAEPRDVHLLAYQGKDAVLALNHLTTALGAASTMSSPVLILYPAPGPGARWEIATTLPQEWIDVLTF
jgi:hypothetical protein